MLLSRSFPEAVEFRKLGVKNSLSVLTVVDVWPAQTTFSMKILLQELYLRCQEMPGGQHH